MKAELGGCQSQVPCHDNYMWCVSKQQSADRQTPVRCNGLFQDKLCKLAPERWNQSGL